MSDELNPYPGNLKRHEVKADEKKQVLMMSTAATKAGESTKPGPYLSDAKIALYAVQYVYPTSREMRRACEWTRDIYEPELQRLRSEVEEQARLLGAGASREAALMAEVERWKKVAQVACDALALIGVSDEHSGHLCEAISHSKDILHEGYQPCPGIRMINSALSQLAENGITPSK